jgi:hypothetical protein
MLSIKVQDLIALQPKTEQIRNICIIAHVDHGMIFSIEIK